VEYLKLDNSTAWVSDMIVSEMIEALKGMPQDAKVVYELPDRLVEVDTILYGKYNHSVYVE
jgi:hypothetical protein